MSLWVATNEKVLPMWWDLKNVKPEHQLINVLKAEEYHKCFLEFRQPEPMPNSELKADVYSVCHHIGNTMLVAVFCLSDAMSTVF
jgi:hypothetical protein